MLLSPVLSISQQLDRCLVYGMRQPFDHIVAPNVVTGKCIEPPTTIQSAEEDQAAQHTNTKVLFQQQTATSVAVFFCLLLSNYIEDNIKGLNCNSAPREDAAVQRYFA
jgi:hypothetical protein